MFGRLKVTPGGATIKTTDYDGLPESLRKSIEITKKLHESVSPIIEQQNKLQQIADAATMPKIAISSPAMDTLNGIADNNAIRTLQENSAAMNALAESTRAMQVFAGVGATIEALHNNSTVRALGDIALKSAIPTYQFESPALKAFETWSNSAVANLSTGLTALVTNPVMQEIQSISSNFGKWLQTVDFSPLTNILGQYRTEKMRNKGKCGKI